jgi:hypothetical protein
VRAEQTAAATGMLESALILCCTELQFICNGQGDARIDVRVLEQPALQPLMPRISTH